MEKFDLAYTISTGSVVRVVDHDKGDGAFLHFVNPLLAPHDIPACRTFDDDRGKHTALPLGEEALYTLMVILMKRFEVKGGVQG